MPLTIMTTWIPCDGQNLQYVSHQKWIHFLYFFSGMDLYLFGYTAFDDGYQHKGLVSFAIILFGSVLE